VVILHGFPINMGAMGHPSYEPCAPSWNNNNPSNPNQKALSQNGTHQTTIPIPIP
jgi:hypothetical protein